MSSREEILKAVKANQPSGTTLPSLKVFATEQHGNSAAFCQVVESLGARIVEISQHNEIKPWIQEHYSFAEKVVSTVPAFFEGGLSGWEEGDGRQLQDVDLAIVEAAF